MRRHPSRGTLADEFTVAPSYQAPRTRIAAQNVLIGCVFPLPSGTTARPKKCLCESSRSRDWLGTSQGQATHATLSMCLSMCTYHSVYCSGRAFLLPRGREGGSGSASVPEPRVLDVKGTRGEKNTRVLRTSYPTPASPRRNGPAPTASRITGMSCSQRLGSRDSPCLLKTIGDFFSCMNPQTEGAILLPWTKHGIQ
jgi:hypothetical protein